MASFLASDSASSSNFCIKSRLHLQIAHAMSTTVQVDSMTVPRALGLRQTSVPKQGTLFALT